MEITLRPWKSDDLDWLVEHANNEKIAKNMTDGFPHPYTADKGKEFISNVQKASPANILAIEADGKLIGSIGIHPMSDIYSQNAELGYWIAEPYWGKGITTKAIEKIVEYTFENFKITRIFAKPFGRNMASRRVLEKAGFVLEAEFENTILKNGKLENELVYAIRK